MNFFQALAQPPQAPQSVFTSDNAGVNELSNTNSLNPDLIGDTSSSSSSSSSSLSCSIIIVSIVISSAIILSVTIYLLLRFISRRFRSSSRTYATTDESEAPRDNNSSGQTHMRSRLDSLPLFKFGSVTGTLTAGDCAVCLSKFESSDQLRLLPLCCHAFHASCIDTWLSSHQTCPLCRSAVYPADADVVNKTVSIRNSEEASFRIEIGSVSRRRGLPDASGGLRAYPIGPFEYIVDDHGFEIPVDSTNRREYLEDKEFVAPPGESLVPESGRNWLKDYVDRLASFSISSPSTSFRGSSRRNDVVVPLDDDLEANRRVGEEITELFRWISGV